MRRRCNSAVSQSRAEESHARDPGARGRHRVHHARAPRRPRLHSKADAAPRSRCSSSTRRTASRSGATISGPPISGSARALRALGEPPVLALTATATDEVDRRDRQAARPQAPAGRQRRRLPAEPATSKFCRSRTRKRRKRRCWKSSRSGGAGIVYVATVKAAKDIHAWLRGARRRRAALSRPPARARERTARQEAFMSGTAQTMVATNAFGMGIDKPGHPLRRALPATREPRGLLPGSRAARDATARKRAARCSTTTATAASSSTSPASAARWRCSPPMPEARSAAGR